MTALLYIHGFLSSPQSHKAQLTQDYLAQHHPEISFHAPALTAYPGKTHDELEAIVQAHLSEPLYLMGSSMGGFWATYLAEKYDLPAVLINPACEPLKLMPNYVGRSLRNYHTKERYRLEPHHLDELAAVDVAPIKRLQNYWLLAQTGDETLDYRKAVAKYQGCKQQIEEGGDHGFVAFERHLPASLSFFQDFYRNRTEHCV